MSKIGMVMASLAMMSMASEGSRRTGIVIDEIIPKVPILDYTRKKCKSCATLYKLSGCMQKGIRKKPTSKACQNWTKREK